MSTNSSGKEMDDNALVVIGMALLLAAAGFVIGGVHIVQWFMG